MNGLECSEILFSYVMNQSDIFRLDSFYFLKEFIEGEDILKKQRTIRLGNIDGVSILSFGAYSLNNFVDYLENGVPFIRCVDMKNGFIDTENLTHISPEAHRLLYKSEVFPESILLSMSGSVGKVAIASPYWQYPMNSNQDIAKIRLHGRLNPYYVYTFFQTRYGQNFMRREARGSVQQHVFLSQIEQIEIPLFSSDFYNYIELLNQTAFSSKDKSKKLLKDAENILLAELNLDSNAISKNNISVQKFSNSFGVSGRLDAEYYQPKYDDYFLAVSSYFNGYSTIRQEFSLIKTKCDRRESHYNYVEIGDVNTAAGFAAYNLINTEDLPDNAKIMTQRGDILVSTVRPNRGAVAILEDDGLLVSGAFTVLREHKAGTYKKEILQVLLRSEIYRDWLLRYNVGTSYPVIKNDDVLNMPIPLLPRDVQREISEKVQESFELRRKAEKLIETAVKAVEIAIERDETAAVAWLNVETESII